MKYSKNNRSKKEFRLKGKSNRNMDTAALFEAIREENLTVMKKLLDEVVILLVTKKMDIITL